MTIEEQVKLDIENARAKKELDDLEIDSRTKIEEIEALISEYNLKIDEYILNSSDNILNELFDLKNNIDKKTQELEKIFNN